MDSLDLHKYNKKKKSHLSEIDWKVAVLAFLVFFYLRYLMPCDVMY